MKYAVIRKLDDADSTIVQTIIDKLYQTAAVIKWEFVDVAVDADIILVVGGDGTMLEGMRQSQKTGIPVVGINIGKVGFLAEHSPDNAVAVLINIASNIENKKALDSRSILREVTTNTKAINEFVISPELAKDTIKYEFFINGVSSGKHHANGLIIATPTGSTAYSLSVGGAIIEPSAPVFQIVPIAPMSLNSRSIVIGDDAKISVIIHTRPNVNYTLIADGQKVFDSCPAVRVNPYIEFVFSKSKNNATLLHSENWNFFTVLQEKLHWNTII